MVRYGLPQCETCLTTRSRFRSLGGLRQGSKWDCDLPECERPDGVIEAEIWFLLGKHIEVEIASNGDTEGQSGGLFKGSTWSGIEQ